MPHVIGQRDVYKDRAVRAIDEFFNGDAMPLDQAFDYARGILGNTSRGLADLTEQAFQQPNHVTLDADQVAHFKSHWPDDVQEEMRRGYAEAIELADGETRVPIETFWVTGPNDEYKIYALRGPRQVTVLVFIPPQLERAAREGWPAEDE
jgi:hypothetical protein